METREILGTVTVVATDTLPRVAVTNVLPVAVPVTSPEKTVAMLGDPEVQLTEFVRFWVLPSE